AGGIIVARLRSELPRWGHDLTGFQSAAGSHDHPLPAAIIARFPSDKPTQIPHYSEANEEASPLCAHRPGDILGSQSKHHRLALKFDRVGFHFCARPACAKPTGDVELPTV